MHKLSDIVAIIVTYNRKFLLRKCVLMVLNQKIRPDVFIVDNASNDGTYEYIKDLILMYDNIFYFNTKSNVGGAGGFYYGIERAFKYGYDKFWLMDDDCMPDENALSILLKCDFFLKGEYGWLASRVVWTDGSLCKMNLPKLKNNQKTYLSHDIYIVKAKQATFVSLLINKNTIMSVGLPIKEFFIWGDDIEYTRRIAVLNNMKSYYVPQSCVTHNMKSNTGSNIAFDGKERISRYYYAFRNEYYLFSKEGCYGIFYYYMKCFFNLIRIFLFSKNKKIERIIVLINGIRDGRDFSPLIKYIKKDYTCDG